MEDLVIVDCQHDFIDGSLACAHAKEGIEEIIRFMKAHEVRALYTSDWHKESNGSFQVNGGIWPIHCVQGSKGASLDERFYEEAPDGNKPGKENIFYKGIQDDVEEYSAFQAKTEEGKPLWDGLSETVYVAGIALEYCVKETVLDLLKAGHKVILLKEGVGYVDAQDVEKVLLELKEKGVKISL